MERAQRELSIGMADGGPILKFNENPRYNPVISLPQNA